MTVDSPIKSHRDLETEVARIEDLLPPLRVATSANCVVIAQGLWQSLEPVALLPAMLHSFWSDQVAALPLNASYTLLPFTHADWASVERSLFTPGAIHEARNQTRWQRFQEGRDRGNDFRHPDWEVGYAQHRNTLCDRLLPASSFLSVESIQPSGQVRRHPRRLLGRHAPRGSHKTKTASIRPQLLIPSPRTTAEADAAVTALADADLLLLNLQQTYGQRTLALARAILDARGPRRPTVIISSRPVELSFLNCPALSQQATTIPIGPALVVPAVRTIQVGSDRPQHERGYELALRQLQGRSPTHNYLVDLGTAAWWAAHQALSQDPLAETAVRRFLAALDNYGQDGDVVGDFSTFRRMLLDVLNSRGRLVERSATITQLVLDHLNRASGAAAVILRTPPSVRALQDELAHIIGCTPDELSELGIYIGTANSLPEDVPIELAIAGGFSGVTTLDALIGTRAAHVALVCDPIEASLVVRSVDKLVPWIASTGEPTAAAKAIGHAAEEIASQTHFMDVISLDVHYQALPPPSEPTAASKAGTSEIVMALLDGSELVTEAGRRFDRLDLKRGTIQSIPASSLQPGDEIVLIDDTAPFSERVITSLDETSLREQVDLRQTWVRLVEAVVTTKRLRKTEIHRQLKAAGVNVDYQTVRAWTSSSVDPERVPRKWEHFTALAHVLGLDLPEEQLRVFYDAARLLRVRHRQAGRDLIRAIRAARLGRLDPVSLERFERSFGIGVRDLIATTRIATIDAIWKEKEG